jgi:endonuclease/exonuclease/phosphatase (EEP) superfamily protein YafD
MLRTAVSVLGWVLLVPSLIAIVALVLLRAVTELHTWHHYVIAAATFIPMLWIPVLIGCTGLILVLRSWWRLVGVAALVISLVVFGWPLRPQAEVMAAPESEPMPYSLSIVSLNVEYGGAEVEELAGLISDGTDVLALQEFTPSFEAELDAAGLLEEFPHRVGTSREGAGGTMLLSRTPLELVAQAEGTVFDNIIATTEVAGALWHIGSIHTAPPQMGAEAWERDAEIVGELAAPFAAENLVLVGDFNAIEQHHTMRRLTADGTLRVPAVPPGAEAQWSPTWPVGSMIPPFARIDHALVSEGTEAWRPSAVAVSGTDHKALLLYAGTA